MSWGKPSTPRDPDHGPNRGCVVVILVGLGTVAGVGYGVVQAVQAVVS